jgi:hypothetical protein
MTGVVNGQWQMGNSVPVIGELQETVGKKGL